METEKTPKTPQENPKTTCESCGMPIESGPYCTYCVDDSGMLQPFDERFERMVQWAQRHEPGLDRAAAEKKTLEYMGTMPAWKDHPRVRGQA
jgi:hypothetical protein